jgi:hypothetical protein
MPDMFKERTHKSPQRHALDRLLERMKQIVGEEIDGLRVWYRAQALIGQIDQAYEVSSRSQQMLGQMLAGDWEKSELPGVARASIRTQALISFMELDDNPLTVGHKVLRDLVEKGHGEKKDEDVLIDSGRYLDQVRKANDTYKGAMANFEKCAFDKLTESSQTDFLQSQKKKFEEICKCLL